MGERRLGERGEKDEKRRRDGRGRGEKEKRRRRMIGGEGERRWRCRRGLKEGEIMEKVEMAGRSGMRRKGRG